MFTLIKEEKTYSWLVEIWIPRDGGKKVKVTMNMTFGVLPQSEQNDLIARGGDVDDDTLWRVVRGWKEGDVQDENGQALPYNEEVKRNLLNVPYVRAATARAYFASINGARD